MAVIKEQKVVKAVLLLRKDSLANWQTNNPILRAGEMSYVTDLGRCKVGDGQSRWTQLPFFMLETDYMEATSGIVLKPESTWRNGAGDPISNRGIIYIYASDTAGQPPKMKVGDGTSYIKDLPFITDDLQDQIDQHINNSNIHVSPQDRAVWDNKLNNPNLGSVGNNNRIKLILSTGRSI